ncbi:MAG: ABC transporter permease [Prevotella sp.]|nr:ABC transporter permease [Prevotella sp.]
MNIHLKAACYTTVSFAILLVVWQVSVSILRVDELLFPSPVVVFRALIDLIADGTLLHALQASMVRFAIGYVLAVLAGIGLGLLLGLFSPLFRYSYPVIQLIRPIAPVAWMPFIVLLLGIGDIPAIAIIFMAGFFPVLLTTASAVHHIDPIYDKVAENYGVGRLKYVFGIVVPAVFPQIANSLHIALGTSWIFLVSGEMVGTQSGLGYMIIDARNNMRTDQLLATMIAIGLTGFVLDVLVGRYERYVVTRWGA